MEGEGKGLLFLKKKKQYRVRLGIRRPCASARAKVVDGRPSPTMTWTGGAGFSNGRGKSDFHPLGPCMRHRCAYGMKRGKVFWFFSSKKNPFL
jgi:hypothetical protein